MPYSTEFLDSVIKAYDIRGLVDSQLSSKLAHDVGTLFVQQVKSTVVIGEDMRPSSPQLADAFASGVMEQGFDVIRIGLASTDQLYFASGYLNLPGAMFTASHNPAEYNGIKLCRAGAAPVGKESGLTQIRDGLLEELPAITSDLGSTTSRDVLLDYVHHLQSLVDIKNIRPLKIVVDAGNGMGGHTVPRTFENLPITLIPLYFELDGTFPNHEANPIDPANLKDLQAAVSLHGADLGLAFDGDADRCFVVDENANIVSPSTLTALIAARELAKAPGAPVIYNLISSKAVPEVIREHGGVSVQSRVGHSYIKALMASEGAVFGGEHSGHFYFANFWNADSGMLAALHVISALGNTNPGTTLSSLLQEFDRYSASGEINSKVVDAKQVMNRIKEIYKVQTNLAIDELDGITVSAGDWWFNVRASNTEPLLRLNVEAESLELMNYIKDEVLGVING